MAKASHEKEYKLKIENVTYNWPNQFITGAEVRTLGPGIPESMDLYVKEHGKTGRLVKNDDSFDLDNPGIEKFYSQDNQSGAGV